ncbi:hypothetical protein AB5N19_00232 [Seiridium cardinale]
MGVNGQSSRFFLLPAYITFETARAIITYSATHAGVSISPTFITLCTELSKALFTTIFLLRNIYNEHGSINLDIFLATINSISAAESGQARWRSYVTYAIPSFLYLISNLLYLLALQSITPALLHVVILAKLPMTAVVHHFLLRRQNNIRAWISLLLLCAGLVITNVSPGVISQFMGGEKTPSDKSSSSVSSAFAGVVMGMVIAVISSFTSIYTEVVMKQKVAFWVAQFWLYTLGSAFAATAHILWDGSNHPKGATIPSTLAPSAQPSMSNSLASSAIIITTTATGLVVANILRKSDNLVKLVGTSASIVTIIMSQCLVSADLRRSTLTVQTVLGAGLVSIATWCYHFYKGRPSQREYSAVANSDDFELGDSDSASDENEKDAKSSMYEEASAMEPTPIRVTASVLFVIFLAVATALFGPSPKATI